jgi:hypothetical protein
VNEPDSEQQWAVDPLRCRISYLKKSTPAAAKIALWAFSLPGLVLPAQSQQEPQALSPSEALRWAMDPFNQARSQNGDLTNADKLALSLGETRAAHDCLSLRSAPPMPAPPDPAEMLALGKLCLFGQQFEPARATLVQYLALPSPPERETALVLLARAFLGLKSSGSAATQVLSLFRDYPYDAEIDSTADQAISACETMQPMVVMYALPLCKKQAAATLPLLVQGKPLQGKDGIISAARLFTDALRCSTLAKNAGDPIPNDSLDDLGKIVEQPNWEGTADLPLMQEAMARARMVGQAVPLRILHARQVASSHLVIPRVLALRHGTVVLAFFTMWSPSATEAIENLANAAPSANIYAVTSWRANTGETDEPSTEILSLLRAMSQGLPRKFPLLVIPDAELNVFHLDQFPAAVAIDRGIVLSNVVLADQGSIHLAVAGIEPAPSVEKPSASRKVQ